MVCEYCGAYILKRERFCERCGAPKKIIQTEMHKMKISENEENNILYKIADFLVKVPKTLITIARFSINEPEIMILVFFGIAILSAIFFNISSTSGKY